MKNVPSGGFMFTEKSRDKKILTLNIVVILT